MMTSQHMFAHKRSTEEGTFFDDVYLSRAAVRMCEGRSPEIVYEVCAREAGEYETCTHFGWQDTGSTIFVMVQPHKRLFELQFPYGSKTEIDAGLGQVVRLILEEC